MELKELSLQEKIGQMILLGIDGNKITKTTRELIEIYKIGGFILYSKNFKNYQQMIKLINELKEINKINKIPLFIAIDQEGGRVNRMPKEILNLPSANLIAKKMGIEGVVQSAKIIGKMLKNSGYNLNFAPVLDIKRFEDKHAIRRQMLWNNKRRSCKIWNNIYENIRRRRNNISNKTFSRPWSNNKRFSLLFAKNKQKNRNFRKRRYVSI